MTNACSEQLALMCMICIEDLPRQFDALLARLHPQLMLIFATIVLDLPKSTLGSFDHCRGPCGAFFRMTLPRWRTGTFV